jgi:hypothetical protein
VAKYQGDFNCDSCGEYFDGDPIRLLTRTPELFGLTDPVKVRELADFWLCGECKVEYPNGAKDFFVADYFEIEDPYCQDCEIEPVSTWGNSCGCV